MRLYIMKHEPRDGLLEVIASIVASTEVARAKASITDCKETDWKVSRLIALPGPSKERAACFVLLYMPASWWTRLRMTVLR